MEERVELTSYLGGFTDYYSIIKDVSREWMTILIITICSGLIAYMTQAVSYRPVYRTQTTMVITATGTYNDIYNNLRSASGSASNFSRLLNSSVLKTMVAKEMGQKSFVGNAKAEVLEGSNLLVLTVEADTPETAFKEMKGILQYYSVLTYQLMGNVRLTLLEPPRASGSPVNPLNAKLLVIRVMVFAMAAVSFLLAVFSALRDTIRNSRDVERKLDAKLLSSVHREMHASSINTAKIKETLKSFKSIKSVKDLKSLRSGRRKEKTSSILITNPATSFRFVETLKKLGARTTNIMGERHAHSLLITSIMENEGKSTISSNLAIAMAEEGNKVILIDADFRKPALYKYLNMQDVEFAGLSDYLLKDTDFDQMENMVQKIPGTEVDCILNKNAMPQTMEMLSSTRMRDLLHLLKKRYDYVIVDSSPMQLVADAEEIADMVDASILVVRQHYVEAKQINDGIDALNSKRHSRMIGCVFNYAHTARFGSVGMFAYGYGGYSYGYGYGHKYGYGGHYER